MKLLLDADLLRYEIGYSCEMKEGPPMSTSEVTSKVHAKIDTIVDMSKCDTFEVFIGGESHKNFRYKVYPEYKGGRSAPKPHHFRTIGDILKDDYQAWTVVGAEVDDVISILGRSEKEVVVGSRDKDLRQVPGWHFDWGFNTKKHLYFTTPFGDLELVDGKLIGSGKMWFYAQILMGDRVDNYFGIPRLGPVAAYNLLLAASEECELWEATYWAYQRHYGEEGLKELLKNARMAYMLEEGDLMYDDTGVITVEPKGLWSPPFAVPVGH